MQKSLHKFQLARTLESGIEVGQGINVGPGKLGKKNKRRALNTRPGNRATLGPLRTYFYYCTIVGLIPVIFWGVRNNWYQSYNSTMIEIGAQKSQSGPIAWPSV